MKFDVAIIGGGAMGTMTFRLLSKYFNAILLEKNIIGKGTSKNCHQNLVGGLRYVIKDEQVASECAEENKILSNMYPEIIGDKNNYFVGFRNDYTEKALSAAKKIGVYTKELDIKDVIKEIPNLNKNIDIAVETSDKNIDSERLCLLNCNVAIENGSILMEQKNIKNIIEENKSYKIILDESKIKVDKIINTAGPWVNSIMRYFSIELPLSASQGTIILQKTLSKRGLQIFNVPSDGDAYIVHNDLAWLGTTSVEINSPIAVEDNSADEILKEKFSVIMPEIKNQKTITQFTGVRALLKTNKKIGRDLSRDYKIVEKPLNIFSVIGGKLTTSRLIANNLLDIIKK